MKKYDSIDKRYMSLAISLAQKGMGKTSPNPAVGAVLVKNGKIIAAAYHKKAGLSHAEVLAMKKAGTNTRGATLYCTLEACTHYGKTPPCVDAIIKNGVKRAVFAMNDPNPVNHGRGIAKLKQAGIKTECGLLKNEAESLNHPFIKFMRKQLPYVTIKIAESLDGKIADSKGNSKWITSEASRKLVHKLRAQNDAVIIGINTLLKDNPLLTNRYYSTIKRQPLRIILDEQLRTPLTSRILKSGKDRGAVLIVGGKSAPRQKKSALERKGAEVVLLPEKNGRVRLISALKCLKSKGVMSILCEGGGEVISSFIREHLADEIYFFIAPKIIGGKLSPTSCGGPSSDIKHLAKVKNMKIERIGPDILIRGDL